MRRLTTLSLLAVTAIFGTSLDAAANEDRAAEFRSLYERPTLIPFPDDNPYSYDKAVLGKMLFFEPRVSRAANMSCASCHNPSFGWESSEALAVGALNEKLGRHSPTVLNLAWSHGPFFWDGRAATLEEQLLGPIEAPVEMDMPIAMLKERLSDIPGYVERFEQVFPGEGITSLNVRQALATYERTIVSGEAPFDRWVAGDVMAINDAAKRGFVLFNEKAQCSACHVGWNFTDHGFHDVGMPSPDLGAGGLDGADPSTRHTFKTPGLRNIAQRAPFMHDGSLPDLAAVTWHYNGGGVDRPTRSPFVRPLGLTPEEVDDLVAFMETLSGTDEDIPLPVLPN